MCGIAGVVGGPADAEALRRMAGAMAHRGPDAEGVWEGEGAGLAFRRLAIIDLDERSGQPMHLGRWHLIFNGEIYNYVELRRDLERLGHRFATTGDTEVLLHAWQEWQEAALDRVAGMFAFAVWDHERRELTLATDPFGEKPLMLRRDGARLAFASDVRALAAGGIDPGPVDEDAVRDYAALGRLPVAPRTFFAGVQRLPGAHVARWRDGRLELRRYWAPRRIDVPARYADAVALMRETLTDAVRLRLRSDVPVGTSLSGGVDSSAIVGLVGDLAPDHRRHAFTAVFPGFERDEQGWAGVTAQRAGVVHHHLVEPAPEDLLADLEALVAGQEEPFASTSIYAQWRVMRAAREAGVIVLLDGQGADELLGGYPGLEGLALRSRGPRAALRAVLAGSHGAAVARAYAAGRVPSALGRRERLGAASPYVTAATAGAAAADAGLAHVPGAPEARDPLRRELLRQTLHTSLPHLLRYADRNSMAHSVELRLPFLDRRIADLAVSVPAAFLQRDGVTKRILRDALHGIIAPEILARRDKVGFETPEARWLGAPDGRARLAEALLDGGAADGVLDRAAIERDVAAGAWRDVPGIWRAVNLVLWRRQADALRRAPLVAA